MYFDQSNIECWKDLAREHGKQIQSLEEKLESKRKRDRLMLAGQILAAMWANPALLDSLSIVELSVEQADALLAELDKETQDAKA